METDETRETETTKEAEAQVGTGSAGTHPAPAIMPGEDGVLRQHGEGPTSAGDSAPEGDSSDRSDVDVDQEAQAKLNAEHEPDQVETDRPDLGTPTE